MIRLTIVSRFIAFVAGCWLIASGHNQMAARSGLSETWQDEKSFMALQLRAQGANNIGLGWLALGSAFIGVKVGRDQTDEDAKAQQSIEELVAFAKATATKSEQKDLPKKHPAALPPNLPISKPQ